MAITWKNVGGADVGSSLSAYNQGINTLQSGFDPLNQVLQRHRDANIAQQKQAEQANVNKLLGTIYGAGSLDELNAARQNVLSGLDPNNPNNKQIFDAISGQMGALSNLSTQDLARQKSQKELNVFDANNLLANQAKKAQIAASNVAASEGRLDITKKQREADIVKQTAEVDKLANALQLLPNNYDPGQISSMLQKFQTQQGFDPNAYNASNFISSMNQAAKAAQEQADKEKIERIKNEDKKNKLDNKTYWEGVATTLSRGVETKIDKTNLDKWLSIELDSDSQERVKEHLLPVVNYVKDLPTLRDFVKDSTNSDGYFDSEKFDQYVGEYLQKQASTSITNAR